VRPSTRSLRSLAQDEEIFFVPSPIFLILSKRSASNDAGWFSTAAAQAVL